MTEAAQGKTVFVAGGARGIGAGIVNALANDGFNVSFSYSASIGKAEALRDELRTRLPEQTFNCHQVDMSDRVQVDEFTTLVCETEGLYGLAYNAGGSYDSLAALVDQDRAEALFQLNFWALTRIAGGVARPLMRAKAGRILTVGSITAMKGVSGNSIYAASKGAMLSYIRTLAIEIARKGVTANYISPGYVDTDLMAPYAAYREKVERQIPLRRFAHADEVGALAAYLFSPLAGYITGAVIPIDGGTSAGLSIQT